MKLLISNEVLFLFTTILDKYYEIFSCYFFI